MGRRLRGQDKSTLEDSDFQRIGLVSDGGRTSLKNQPEEERGEGGGMRTLCGKELKNNRKGKEAIAGAWGGESWRFLGVTNLGEG